MRLDLAAAFSSARRSPEMVIREAIQVAESLSPAVLWVDEIEKGFAASAADPSSSRVFGAFLTWLSEKQAPVFVVATANDVAGLPPELLRRRRLDELFFIDGSQSETMPNRAIVQEITRHLAAPVAAESKQLTERGSVVRVETR